MPEAVTGKAFRAVILELPKEHLSATYGALEQQERFPVPAIQMGSRSTASPCFCVQGHAVTTQSAGRQGEKSTKVAPPPVQLRLLLGVDGVSSGHGRSWEPLQTQ